jgi:hypothetical protein
VPPVLPAFSDRLRSKGLVIQANSYKPTSLTSLRRNIRLNESKLDTKRSVKPISFFKPLVARVPREHSRSQKPVLNKNETNKWRIHDKGRTKKHCNTGTKTLRFPTCFRLCSIMGQ